jgi:hypothetical protein
LGDRTESSTEFSASFTNCSPFITCSYIRLPGHFYLKVSDRHVTDSVGSGLVLGVEKLSELQIYFDEKLTCLKPGAVMGRKRVFLNPPGKAANEIH